MRRGKRYLLSRLSMIHKGVEKFHEKYCSLSTQLSGGAKRRKRYKYMSNTLLKTHGQKTCFFQNKNS